MIATKGCIEADGTIRRMRGYVLAGGESRRMGSPKKELMLGASTFLDRIVSAIAPLVSHVSVVTRYQSGPTQYDTVVEPSHDGAAAIYGIACALRHADDDAFVVAVDYPLVTTEALRSILLAHRPRSLTLPEWDGVPQMVCAIYPASMLPLLDEKILKKKFELHSLLAALTSFLIPEDLLRKTLEGEPFRNVNTPEDYLEVRRIYESTNAH